MSRCLVLAAVSLSVLAFVAAGCGGGGGGDDTRGTVGWANDLCASITTWQDSIADAVRSLRDAGLSRPALQNAADNARDSTDLFIDELTGLGTPDTQAGAEAKDIVDELGADLGEGMDDIQAALSGSSTVAGAFTSVTNTLTTMGNQLTSTLTQLGQLDAQDDIESAFKDADSCKSLSG